MHQRWMLLTLLVWMLVGLAACDPAGDVTADPSIETPSAVAAEPARDFSLETLDGQVMTLSELRGQWVVLNFWATWCPPCIKEMPYLNRLAQERELRVLGVNFNEDAATVRRFVEENGISFPILMQPDEITLLVFQVRALPRTFVIAPDGAIVQTIMGEIDPVRLDGWLDDQGVARQD